MYILFINIIVLLLVLLILVKKCKNTQESWRWGRRNWGGPYRRRWYGVSHDIFNEGNCNYNCYQNNCIGCEGSECQKCEAMCFERCK